MTTVNTFEPVSGARTDDRTSRLADAVRHVAMLSADTTPVDQVLTAAGRWLCDLLGATRLCIRVLDEHGQRGARTWHDVVTIGAGNEITRLLDGPAGAAFTAELISSSSPAVAQDPSDPPHPLSASAHVPGANNVLGIPLLADDTIVGLLFVDHGAAEHVFTDQDVQIAQVFANLASLAIAKTSLGDLLTDRALEVTHQKDLQRRSGDLHAAIAQAVSNGSRPADIVTLLAMHLRKPVVLYDDAFRVTHWSAAPDGTDATCPAPTRGQRSTLWTKDLLARLETGVALTRARPELPHRRMVARLMATDEPLGYLEIREAGRPFDEVDSRVIGHAATALSLVTLTARRKREIAGGRIRELMELLIRPHGNHQETVETFHATGLEATDRYGIAFLTRDRSHQHSGGASSAERAEAIASIVDAKLSGTPGVRLVSGIGAGDADVLLYAVTPDEGGEAAMRSATRDAMGHLAQIAGIDLAVVSSAYPDPVDLIGLVDDARNLAGALAAMGCTSEVFDLSGFSTLQLVHRQDGMDGAVRHAERMIRPLRQYDDLHHGALVSTLHAYITAQTNMKIASVALGVHENTIRYRLSRIRSISTIDPDRFDDLVRVQSALQILDLMNSGQPSMTAGTRAS